MSLKKYLIDYSQVPADKREAIIYFVESRSDNFWWNRNLSYECMFDERFDPRLAPELADCIIRQLP